MNNFNYINLYDGKETNLNKFFHSLELEKFIIVFSVFDEASNHWVKFTERKKLGLNETPAFRASYLAIVDKSVDFVYEKTADISIAYDYATDVVKVHVSSAGFGKEPYKSEIIVNGIDYSYNLRGLNIVIIDRESGVVKQVLNSDLFADENLRIDTVYKIFENRLNHVVAGMRLAEKYCVHSNSVLYMILNRHIGDAARVLKDSKAIKDYYGLQASRYHFGSDDINSQQAKNKNIKKEFKKVKCIKNIIVITNSSIAGVARLYSQIVDDVIILSQSELDDIELYALSNLGLHENIIPDQNAQGKLLSKWYFDEGSWARWEMFGINDTMWNLCLPKELKFNDYNMELNEQTIQRVETYLKEEHIDIKKMTILCPQSKSSSMLENSVWVKFSNILKQKGYDVFTNIGPNEQPICGTKKLQINIDEVVCMSKMGAYVIGVQCGLMDTLLWANCSNLIILSLIENKTDLAYARVANSLNEVNKKPNNVTYLRIEHFEEDYVLKLLMDNFH